ncbi:precorrin-3B synthase [uncultured Roseobacter sp.]|uniref:precorrin-3B synthase n=1 Tax=uncultured Roseobacter sp. TaxID=114847 RepID=UPI0026374946|nr:precorrin-3B synthase [uncultured Roseobacter sp.]
MSAIPKIKGWCPGAWRPMMSGDGLVVRIRPHLNRLTRDQGLRLADLAKSFGSGIIDLTSRANLQIRGVSTDRHQGLIAELSDAGLLDPGPELEARRNIICAPFWQAGDLTDRLHTALMTRLPELPLLPAKMGIAIDVAETRSLSAAPADFRLERSLDGSLVLRADGASQGVAVTEADAPDALLELANWFVRSGGADAGRMKKHLTNSELPGQFRGTDPAPDGPLPEPGQRGTFALFGAAFGAIDAAVLHDLLRTSGPTGLRTTPWRLFALENTVIPEQTPFISAPGDPALRVSACPGAPFCTQAQVATRALARKLAPALAPGQSLHVSGCAKGCAHPAPADITVAGAMGAFDLVRNGTAWDEPHRRGLSEDDILKEVAQ